MDQLLTFIAGLVVGVVLFRLVTRRPSTVQNQVQKLIMVVKPLAANAARLKTSSQTLTNSCTNLQNLSDRLNGEIAKIQELVAAVAHKASFAAKRAENGSGKMAQLKLEIDRLTEIAQTLQENARNLDQVAIQNSSVSEKTALIGEVAFETKILSFNASIEAERAGEAGRGFSVVAKELQSLANKTDQAAKEIAGKIRDNELALNQATVETNRNVRSMVEFVKKSSVDVRHLREIFQAIHESSSDSKQISQQLQASFDQMIPEFTSTTTEVHELHRTASASAAISQTQQQAVEDLNKAVSDIVGDLTGSRVIDLPVEKAAPSIKQFTVIDVRGTNEFNDELGHISGAKRVTISEDFQDKIKDLPRHRPYLVVCRSGGRSARAARQFLELGFRKVYNLGGGMLKWKEAHLPTERDQPLAA